MQREDDRRWVKFGNKAGAEMVGVGVEVTKMQGSSYWRSSEKINVEEAIRPSRFSPPPTSVS